LTDEAKAVSILTHEAKVVLGLFCL